MATVTFYLNKNKEDKKGRYPIILQFDHNKQRFKYYTGEKIDPKYWSKSKNSYIKPSYDDDSTLDNYLKGLVAKIEKIVRDAKNDEKIITADNIKRKFLETASHKSDNTFFSLFDRYISSAKSTRTAGTIKNYNNVLACLKKYRDEKGFDFGFDQLNPSFNEKFVAFLITEKEFSNNTIGKHIKTLKSFLTWATENKYNRNLDFQKFKVSRENIEIVYLTDTELKNLSSLTITDEIIAEARKELKLEISRETLEAARDLFCFGCFTGLRFSDIASLAKNNIKENEILVRTLKTKDLLNIPLIPPAASILKKYNNLLPVISNQKLNQALKALGKGAKINQEVAIQRYRGAKRLDTKIPKYKLITTHTARRTFITLSLEKGIRPEVVMAITGHKDYKTFKAYIKITDSVKKEALLNAWK